MQAIYFHPDASDAVAMLADGFQLIERARPPSDVPGFHLWAVADHLELRHGDQRRGSWVSVAELERRSASGSELLRACGIGAGGVLRVLDPMAGWGVDALALAARGCSVTMVERQAVLVALQADLQRRSRLPAVRHCGDGYHWLEAASHDVVYLDPMFPTRRKGALPGKRMQWLAHLGEPDSRPLEQWLAAAVACASGRVVLKRRRTDPLVGTPDWQISGRSVRYDVFRGAASGRSCSTA